MTRRELLAALSALPALAQQPARGPSGTPKFSDYPFQLGVASGDPSPDGAVIWTRLAPKPLEGGGMPAEDARVEWQVAEDEAMSRVVRSGSVAAKRELAHSVRVEADGLRPDRWYFYRFRAGSEISPVARLRTAPAPDVLLDRLKFAFASCQHYESGYYTALDHMAREAPDLVFHLGDYIYEGAGRDGRVRKHAGPEITALEHYRTRYAQYKSDKDLQTAHHACPWIVTWDDHEVDNNYAGAVSEELDVGPDELLTRRAHAYQAYYEHMPLRATSRPRGHDMQLYRRVPFGRLADFAVLDTRQYRSDQPCGDKSGPECPDVFREDGTILGHDQEQWLYRTLENSPAKWNVIPQQVLVARVDVDPSAAELYSMDKWASYRKMLDRFSRFLAERKPSNPVVLTGDIHSNWVADLFDDWAADRPRPVAAEFVGTSISSGGDGGQRLDYARDVVSANPCLKFYNGERGYVSCEMTAGRFDAHYRTVEYVTRPGAPVRTRASFVVEDGRPGVVPA